MKFLKKTKILIIIILIISTFYIIENPIKKEIALNKFYEYISAQGIDKTNIITMQVSKDHIHNCFVISVIYKDDVLYTYNYTYYSWKGNKIYFSVYFNIPKHSYNYNKEDWDNFLPIEHCKYKPLKRDDYFP